MSRHSSNKHIVLNKVPNHIVFIPDGNRRWAKKNGLPVLKGHEKGIDNIGEVLKWCQEFGIKHVTLWGFSTENRSRSPEEVHGLINLFETKLTQILNKAEKEKNKKDLPKVRIRFYGEIDKLSIKLKKYIQKIENETKKNDEYFVNFLLNYGGKHELLKCITDLAEEYKKGSISRIDENVIRSYLITGDIPNADAVVRTSGEYRLSGLLPLQSGYSELFFIKKYWPDFSKEDFVNVLKEYSKRERRFGR